MTRSAAVLRSPSAPVPSAPAGYSPQSFSPQDIGIARERRRGRGTLSNVGGRYEPLGEFKGAKIAVPQGAEIVPGLTQALPKG